MTKRILLCDDEVHILRAAEIKLQRAGYDVQCAGDGQEGWELVQAGCPDLLITDCQMPRLDGFGLVARIRENPACAHLPVLMLTAKGFERSFQDAGAEHGILAILPKPFSPRELLRCVEQVLTTGRLEQPAAMF